MSKNENVHEMRMQILSLRSAGIACATAIHYFPPCCRPESDRPQCAEARVALKQLYEGMNELLFSTRMALAAVFHPDSEGWDFLWELAEESTCAESDMAKFGQYFYSDQDEYIRFYAGIDSDMMRQLGRGFSDEEWKVLTAKGAWQNGKRLPHVLSLLKYLEDQIAKKFDLFDSGIQSGLLGDCNLGKRIQKKAQAPKLMERQ